jgi:flagellar hook-associated protein 3 FlgL
MRIASTTVSEGIIRQIQQLNADQAKLQTQVATGQRITLPEDDPASVGRVLNLQTQQRQVTQWKHNTARAQELAQSSFSALSGLKDVSSRAGELATLGSGTLGADAMAAYGSETNQLIEHTLQVANSRFSQDYIFGGTAVDTPPFTAVRDASGQITSISYTGNSTAASSALSETSAISPLTDGSTNSGIADFLNQLVALRDRLNANDSAGVRTVQTNLATSEDTIVNALADNGGVQARIEAANALHTARFTSLTSLVSSETSADLSAAIVKLKQTQTAYEAALQSGASIMQLSLLDYIK